MLRWCSLILVLTACSKSTSSEQQQQQPPPKVVQPDTAGALGTVSFAVTDGSPEARGHFARGIAALHSFWYDEAVREFQAAIEADPTMPMAYWGAAMSRCKLYWHEDDVEAARALLQKMPTPEKLSPRERAWVSALNALLSGRNPGESRKRFVAAMEALHAKFPDDESATFLAVALLSASRPGDPDDLAVRKRAGELARGVFQHNPDHPGAAHYFIHAYDTPELAPEALSFAKAYAKIAPAAFHARHMPAHIFARLGMWKEAIESCQSAWAASIASAEHDKLSADHYDLHSLNWLVEMSFERGHRKDADAALALYQGAVRQGLSHQQREQYAIQVTSYLARTGEWKRVDELLAPLDTPATDDPARTPTTPPAEPGSTHCAPSPASSPTALLEQLAVADARARAAAGRHDVAATKQRVEELIALRAQMQVGANSAQADERRRRAFLARATGDDRTLLAAIRDALAAGGDQEPPGEANPRGYLVREELADVLLRLGQAKEAAAEYDNVLARHPGRGRALLGAARALAKAGDAAGARARYQQLVALWDSADPGFPGLAEARAAVAR